MAWSTRQLAEMAGTTVKSVRYYHQLGLLEEQGRLSNGYEQYEVRHLVRLLQITRLTDLGVPLAEIQAFGGAGEDPDADAAEGAAPVPSPVLSPELDPRTRP